MDRDPDCIFCKIIAGDIPSEIVFEDEHCIAIMDIAPVAPGHILLIPKIHVEIIDQLADESASMVLASLPRLVRTVRQATRCEGINVLQNNGMVAGQLVPHVHFHIIPRNSGDAFEYNWPAREYGEGEMKKVAAEIRAGL